MINIFYTLEAARNLEQIDSCIAKRIIGKISQYKKDPHPITRAKSLSGNWQNRFRYRIGNYRAIFKYDKKIANDRILKLQSNLANSSNTFIEKFTKEFENANNYSEN